jgi:hypothetical protein
MVSALNVLKKSFFCFVHDPADISQASPAERVVRAAVAPSALLLRKYSLHDQGAALVFEHIPRYVPFRIYEAVANPVFHGNYIPAFFSIGTISSNA